MKVLDLLTPKQRTFVIEYAQGKNGVIAARIAGYKGDANQLSVIAAQNLGKLRIQQALEEFARPALEEAQINVKKIVDELVEIAFSQSEQISVSNKIRALQLIGEHLGMFNAKRSDQDFEPSFSLHLKASSCTDAGSMRRTLLEHLRGRHY